MGSHYYLDFWPVLEAWRALLGGFGLTVLLSAIGIFGGTALGILGALGRWAGVWPLRWALRVYVELFRNTPLLVQLFLIFFGLPSLGVRLSPIMAACLALLLNNAAYTSEIVRAGLVATPRGQIEAARSLALNYRQTLLLVVVRPALARIYPALVSQNVLLMLSTSITSTIGVNELTAASDNINSDTFRSIEVFVVAAALYLALNYAQRVLLWAVGRVLFPNRRAWS